MQRDEFRSEGYLTVELDVDPALLDGIVEALATRFDASAADNPRGTRIQDAWAFDLGVHRLSVNVQVLELLRALFGRAPRPFQTLNFPVGTQQAPHSDTIHFNSCPSGYMCGVWVALEDVDLDNGPLVYYPGSHLWPELTMQDLGLGPGYSHYKDYERQLADRITDTGIEPAYGVMPKGSALIWHPNLVHGGAPLRSRERTRHSQVTHYFFEGCKYYTPMNSTAAQIEWRQPQWIPLRARRPSAPEMALRRALRLPGALWRRIAHR